MTIKNFFNITRNIFAVIGLILTIALIIILSSDEYSAIRGKAHQKSASHNETLKLSGTYGKDRIYLHRTKL